MSESKPTIPGVHIKVNTENGTNSSTVATDSKDAGKAPENNTEATTNVQKEQTLKEELAAKERELDEPYVDKRTVVIAPVEIYSAYRNANKASMPTRRLIIGSSIKSSRVLSSSKGEVEAYFPELIGLSPNNQEFITHVKAYLNNISFNVSDHGTTLNISFRYNHKRDYLRVKAEEDKINARRDAVAKNNTAAVKNAVDTWVDEINNLESTKYLYGRPENVEHYLIYRHCILYREVAKDISLINTDSSLRFYIRDEVKEAERAKRLVDERKKAMRKFLALEASDKKSDAVYIQMVVSNGGNVGEALTHTKDEKIAALMAFVNESPDKFNKLVDDEYVEMKAFIEALIARGELIRPEFNQQISTADGTFIGSNMSEAIAYFNNPNNAAMLEVMQNKFKLF